MFVNNLFVFRVFKLNGEVYIINIYILKEKIVFNGIFFFFKDEKNFLFELIYMNVIYEF